MATRWTPRLATQTGPRPPAAAHPSRWGLHMVNCQMRKRKGRTVSAHDDGLAPFLEQFDHLHLLLWQHTCIHPRASNDGLQQPGVMGQQIKRRTSECQFESRGFLRICLSLRAVKALSARKETSLMTHADRSAASKMAESSKVRAGLPTSCHVTRAPISARYTGVSLLRMPHSRAIETAV